VDKAADITIFDTATVGDRATISQPQQYTDGNSNVILNGHNVVEHGTQHAVFPGKILHKSV
jgi:N-acyl-D-amino-acid deacylase